LDWFGLIGACGFGRRGWNSPSRAIRRLEMQKVDLNGRATPQTRSSNVNSAKNLEPRVQYSGKATLQTISGSKLEI
jgi:hypothetical protein